jgi:hypothetical protein
MTLTKPFELAKFDLMIALKSEIVGVNGNAAETENIVNKNPNTMIP